MNAHGLAVQVKVMGPGDRRRAQSTSSGPERPDRLYCEVAVRAEEPRPARTRRVDPVLQRVPPLGAGVPERAFLDESGGRTAAGAHDEVIEGTQLLVGGKPIPQAAIGSADIARNEVRLEVPQSVSAQPPRADDGPHEQRRERISQCEAGHQSPPLIGPREDGPERHAPVHTKSSEVHLALFEQ